jgi:hypothetical protein
MQNTDGPNLYDTKSMLKDNAPIITPNNRKESEERIVETTFYPQLMPAQ